MKKIVGALIGFCGLVLCVGINTAFKVCDSMDKVMKCTYSSRIITALGAIIIVNALFMIHDKAENINSFIRVNTMLLSALVILVPSKLIGGCAKMDMRCQQITFPFVYAIAICIEILCFISLFIGKRK